MRPLTRGSGPFDSLYLSSFGFGGDPNDMVRLRAEQGKWYDFLGLYAAEAMSRPTLEVADIVRASGNRFWEHHGCPVGSAERFKQSFSSSRSARHGKECSGRG